jgi:APA family basic amino acid/polyamine antiporter
MTAGHKKFRLKKELTLFTATLYGIGIILGAGIYALIGEGAGIAGNGLWISFIIAAVIAAFTGLSYAELSSMYPKEAAEYVYTKNAFRRKWLSFLVSWALIVSVIIAASTVALGFAGYFSYLFGFPVITVAASLIIVLSVINYCGMKDSAFFNDISAIIETAGLLLVIIIGLFFFGTTDAASKVNFFEINNGFSGIFSAVALIIFAYVGFENLANVSEEAKNAKKVIPKALVLSLVISTVLYILVVVSSIGLIGWENLAASKAPLTEVISRAIPQASILMSLIALFATSNTVLILLIAASRLFYGMSREHSMPKYFSKISRHGTPHIAIAIVMVVSILVLFVGSIGIVALLSNIGILLAYFFVNASLIYLRFRKPKMKRLFRSPVNIGRFPVLAFLGAVSCFGMFFFYEPAIILYELVVLLVGFVLYRLFSKS